MRRDVSRLRRVLCAVDLERSSATSLSLASLLGERFDAAVDALYAPALPSDRFAPVEQPLTGGDAHERLSGILASVMSKVPVSSFVTPGLASTVILTHSELHASDLIVMASSPHRRAEAVHTRTITPVALLAPCAVLTVGDRFQPAALRRILLPVGPTGAEDFACSWVTTLASRFDAEVGVIRIDQPRSGWWTTPGPQGAARADHSALDCEQVLDALCGAGIDAYEIAHPGGDDAEALARLCETGAFDAVVCELLGTPEGGNGDAGLVASLRRKTSAPVLSIRATRARPAFAPIWAESPRSAAVGAE